MEKSPRQRQNRKREARAAAVDAAVARGAKARRAARPAKAPVRSRGLDRAVEIFQLLHAVRKPIPIGEIARRLKAPRSTIYEIVNLFLAADILEYAGDGSEVFFGRAIYLYAHDYFATHAMVRLGPGGGAAAGGADRRDLPVLHAGRQQVHGGRRCRTARGSSASAPTSACSCRFRGRRRGASSSPI